MRTALHGLATAYRLGGDEFCVLAYAAGGEGSEPAVLNAVAVAFSMSGPHQSLGCSVGTVVLPSEAANPAEALRVADERMYQQKADRKVTEQPPVRPPVAS